MAVQAPATSIRIKKVLVATDLSRVSAAVIPCALAIAERAGAEITLAHVIPPEVGLVVRPNLFEAIEIEARSRLEEHLDLLLGKRHPSTHCEPVLRFGDVATAVAETVRESAVDLIFVGTSGDTGLKKLLVGSIAEEIILTSPCPVVAVGPAVPHSSYSLKSVLLASDFSPVSSRAAVYAYTMASQWGAKLTLLHAINGVGGVGTAEAAARLQAMAGGYEDLQEAPTLLASGCILEAAREISADLIVLGCGGASWPLMAAHFGSTAHAVVVRAGCPVMTVRLAESE